MSSGVTVITDKTAALRESLAQLTSQEVLAGVPEAKSARDDQMNNATLAYIHNFGSPAQNIPARPFLGPGIAKKQDEIAQELKAAGKDALDLKGNKIGQRLTRVGLLAQAGIRSMFGGGEMAPLKPETITRKGGKKTTPLIDTGQLRNSISFVVRDK
jgi:phage gpG-like protein